VARFYVSRCIVITIWHSLLSPQGPTHLKHLPISEPFIHAMYHLAAWGTYGRRALLCFSVFHQNWHCQTSIRHSTAAVGNSLPRTVLESPSLTVISNLGLRLTFLMWLILILELELDIDELLIIIIIIIIISTKYRKEAQNEAYINPLMYLRW